MLINSFKNIGLVTGILIYLYFCGGVYLIGFWSTFDFDISNFVGLTDIPKNFIYPFIVTNALAFTYVLIQALIQKSAIEEAKNYIEKERVAPRSFFMRWMLAIFSDVNTYILFLFIGVYTFHSKYKFFVTYWAIACFWFGFAFFIKLKNTEWVRAAIPNQRLRLYFSFFVAGFPVICFLTGKRASLDIYNNDEVRAINVINNRTIQPIVDSTSLKLLGFLGDKAIVSSLDNKKMYILNQSAYPGFEVGEVIKKNPKNK